MAAHPNWAYVTIRDSSDVPRVLQIANLQGGVNIQFDPKIRYEERAEAMRQLSEAGVVNYRVYNSNYNKAGLIAVGVVVTGVGIGLGLGLTGYASWETLNNTLKQTSRTLKLLTRVAKLVTEIQAPTTVTIAAPPPR